MQDAFILTNCLIHFKVRLSLDSLGPVVWYHCGAVHGRHDVA